MFNPEVLSGLAGTPDSLELEKRLAVGDKQAALAVEIFCYQVDKQY